MPRVLRVAPTRRLYWSRLAVALLAVVSCSCVTTEERSRPLRQLPAPRIERVVPSSTMVAEGFQVQASGESAISVIGSNFAKASKVILNGRPVSTAFGSSTGVTALVPPELYSREGAIEVAVQNADGQSSNVVLFRVFPLTGPAPRITRLHPESCIVGAPFNVQPDGKSALGVEGSDFTPGAVVYLDRSALNTTFGGPGLLSALLSAELLRTPGRLKVWVRNPDEKESEGAYFEVKPQPVSHGRSR